MVVKWVVSNCTREGGREGRGERGEREGEGGSGQIIKEKLKLLHVCADFVLLSNTKLAL